MFKKILPPKAFPFVIAGIAALIVVMLINTYIKQQAESTRQMVEEAGKNLAVVLIAKEDIPAGKKIVGNMFEERRMPIVFIQPRAADSINRIENMLTLVPILKGEQVLLTKLSLSGTGMSLSMRTPPGKRAISVTVDNISALGGMIQPGDHVDVIGVVPVPAQGADGKQIIQLATMPLFQDVLILAVGSQLERAMSKEEAQKKGEETKSYLPSSVITLALAPQEANLIAFIQEQQGKVRLILRSPTDTQTQTLEPGSWEALIRYVYPQLMQQMPQQAAPPQKIEIYRGTKKEDVNVSR